MGAARAAASGRPAASASRSATARGIPKVGCAVNTTAKAVRCMKAAKSSKAPVLSGTAATRAEATEVSGLPFSPT